MGRRVTVEAVVIRADGSREDLGVVASSDPEGPGTVRRADPTRYVQSAPGMPGITLANHAAIDSPPETEEA